MDTQKEIENILGRNKKIEAIKLGRLINFK